APAKDNTSETAYWVPAVSMAASTPPPARRRARSPYRDDAQPAAAGEKRTVTGFSAPVGKKRAARLNRAGSTGPRSGKVAPVSRTPRTRSSRKVRSAERAGSYA